MDVCFGTDYYPEHWPEERWRTDARLMRDLGLDVVRMGEFAWVKMEPEYGQFDFTWLDQIIEILAEHGVKAILGTPTATPPAWIIKESPDILPVNDMGTRLGFGGRHHCCQSNAVYRGHIRRLVTAMAEHYKDNKNVIGWQTDNELGNSHERLCMCDSCKSSFQAWLEKKYTNISFLNQCWGTIFWSQTYNDFSQIPAPRITPTSHNPSLLLDWRRFCSDLIVEFQKFQTDIIRSITPDRFITHNMMGYADKVNYRDLAADLDFVSHDQYNLGFWQDIPAIAGSSAMPLDLIRGIKDRPFWIMEQQSGIAGWETMGRAPSPGQLRLWTAQSIARGADAVVYFRWRSCLSGTEQYWHGILPHSGVPGRRYYELQKAIAEMKPIMPRFRGSKRKSDVGILFSYDQLWAMQIQPHHPKLNYVDHLKKYHKYFHEKNIPVDFVFPDADFSPYKLIIAPLQYLMTGAFTEKIKEFISAGGSIVLTMRTGVKDEYNCCMSHKALPGDLGDVLGIEILDYDCLRGVEVKVKLPGGSEATAEKWCDIITLKGAVSLCEYASEYYSGTPCATSARFGESMAYYVGCEPDSDLVNYLCDIFVSGSGVAPPLREDSGLELSYREKDGVSFCFVLNHCGEEKDFIAPENWRPAADTGNPRCSIEPFGYRVYTIIDGNHK